jgi:hypothetical protein
MDRGDWIPAAALAILAVLTVCILIVTIAWATECR